MMGAWEKIVPALERLSGDTGVYLCNLVTGDMRAYAADKPVVAASVIKIPVMIEVFRQARDGLLDLNEIHRLSDDERLPSCGTLKAMHTGIEMTLLDLTRLMVIVSGDEYPHPPCRHGERESDNPRAWLRKDLSSPSAL